MDKKLTMKTDGMKRTFRFLPAGIAGLLLPFVIFIIFSRPGETGSPDARQLELQTFQLGDGWGYQIVMNQKVLIYQPTIPTIDTLMPFPDEASAQAIGSIVLEKLNQNRDFTVTITDIHKSLSYFYR